VRLDSTVSAALMHEPSDSTLLCDRSEIDAAVAPGNALRERLAIAWCDRRRLPEAAVQSSTAAGRTGVPPSTARSGLSEDSGHPHPSRRTPALLQIFNETEVASKVIAAPSPGPIPHEPGPQTCRDYPSFLAVNY